MKLNELFDQPNDSIQMKQSGGMVDFTATLSDDSQIDCEFYKSKHYAGRNNWYFSFTRKESGAHDWTRSNGKTGTGNEMEVFATVVEMASRFVAKIQPDVIQFTAEKQFDDPRRMSRANLYKRMAARLAGNAYDVKFDNDPDAVHFTLVKKGFELKNPEMSDYANDEDDDEF